jgi:hypothetical protein
VLIGDDELAAEALAANPDTPVAPDAVALGSLAGSHGPALLPDWYMPAPAAGARRLRGHRRRVAVAVVVTFLLIDAAGLCSTYGHVVVA